MSTPTRWSTPSPQSSYQPQEQKQSSLTVPDQYHATPRHNRRSGSDVYASNIEYPKAYRVAEREVRGKWVSVKIEKFMGMIEKSSAKAEAELSELLELRQPIHLPASENLQYDVVIESMRGYLDIGWQQVNTSAHIDTNIPELFGATGVKPDIILYSPSRRLVEGRTTDMKEAELFWEFKIGVLPFLDATNEKGKAKENPDELEIENDASAAVIAKDADDDTPSDFENRADKAVELRGQITLYNTVIQILQNRTRVFSIYIGGETARLLCHSRAGTVVTLPFNYNKEPYLHQFLFRYTRTTSAQRGHDDTYKEPSNPVEEREARKYLELELDNPLHVVEIASARYYVSKPFTDFHMFPVGRGTKCFSAYCPHLNKLVLLKDIWRKMDYEKEGDTLRKLNDAGVPNVPTLLHHCDIEGNLQKIEAPYRQAMQHYILVTDKIGRPLSSFTSSWEMVDAVCDAIRAHEAAWERTMILHRDISAGNILIYDEPSTSDDKSRKTSRGLLIDWEMAKVESGSLPRTTERTGTHQFLALELMGPVHLPHEPRHDLESFVYVLLWILLRHASKKHLKVAEREDMLGSFDRKRTMADSRAAKLRLLRSPDLVHFLYLDSPWLKNALESIWRPFQAYMADIEFRREGDKSILTHSVLIYKLVSALGQQEWQLAGDAAIEYTVQKRKRENADDQEDAERGSKISRSDGRTSSASGSRRSGRTSSSSRSTRSVAGSTKSSASRTRSRGGPTGMASRTGLRSQG